MWYLLLSVPALAVVMGIVSRFGSVTETDRACTAIDLRLDRQQQLISDGAAAEPVWVPQQRRVSRVAPRPAMVSSELLAS